MKRLVLVRMVLVTGFLVVAAPAWAAIEAFKQPDAYAVVIGISQYREEVIPKVAYAVKDAEAVAQLLETQAGIPKTHIRLLTEAKATGNDLRTVGGWLKMRVKPASTVYVYYAGHGTPNPKTGEAYLVPWDGHPDYPDGLYPLNDLYAALNTLPAKEVVVLLDACFSGAAGRSVLAKGARPMVISVENPLLASGKVIVLAAATGNQISSDYDKAGHGLFTHYLLTGLSGEADTDRDGTVTLKEVFPYVREHVAHTAVEELNREQTPVLLPGEEGLAARASLPLATVLEVASLPSYDMPKQTGREVTGKDGAPMLLVPAGDFIMGQNRVGIGVGGRPGAGGALVTGLMAGGPAERAGLRKDDIITTINGQPVKSVEDIASLLASVQPGARVSGGIRRSGTDLTLEIEPTPLTVESVHRVSLEAFYLDKYEVTNKLFQKFTRETGYETTAEKEGKAFGCTLSNECKEINGANWRKPEGGETVFVSNRDEHPVVSVSWHDAEAYCRWAGKRLPTEAEFEYAVRAGTKTTYWWGDGHPGSRRVANIADESGKRQFSGLTIMAGYDDGYARTAPVGSFEPNPWGLHDMSGNVSEWVADWFDANYYWRSPDRNPTGPSSGSEKVVRGGSWSDSASNVRSAYRNNNTPMVRYGGYGFRCAKTP